MTTTTPPCDCALCACAGAPTVKGPHTFALEEHWDDLGPTVYVTGWRWRCSCGRHGRWTAQSDGAAYHTWLRHADGGRRR